MFPREKWGGSEWEELDHGVLWSSQYSVVKKLRKILSLNLHHKSVLWSSGLGRPLRTSRRDRAREDLFHQYVEIFHIWGWREWAREEEEDKGKKERGKGGGRGHGEGIPLIYIYNHIVAFISFFILFFVRKQNEDLNQKLGWGKLMLCHAWGAGKAFMGGEGGRKSWGSENHPLRRLDGEGHSVLPDPPPHSTQPACLARSHGAILLPPAVPTPTGHHKSSYCLRCILCIMSLQSLNTRRMFSVSTAHVKWG